ncbi:hypothetical protein CYMTET_14434 [Cymbomonas tetramitiformis]|uniref:Uncharacterized protein n=1 Tax=Cymbomonas tetramitiformis TaxID=36881 RepID=A0AAE0GGB9_9CHLO|nr:hypothetical protein CYMTET_14434 [Cymbomonas tetramitiformis]
MMAGGASSSRTALNIARGNVGQEEGSKNVADVLKHTNLVYPSNAAKRNFEKHDGLDPKFREGLSIPSMVHALTLIDEGLEINKETEPHNPSSMTPTPPTVSADATLKVLDLINIAAHTWSEVGPATPVEVTSAAPGDVVATGDSIEAHELQVALNLSLAYTELGAAGAEPPATTELGAVAAAAEPLANTQLGAVAASSSAAEPLANTRLGAVAASSSAAELSLGQPLHHLLQLSLWPPRSLGQPPRHPPRLSHWRTQSLGQSLHHLLELDGQRGRCLQDM